jgi:hypothetical protein
MSGAISIPIAFLAIIFGGKAGFWLAVSGFVALLYLAIKGAWTNYQMMETQKPKETSDLEIVGVPIDIATTQYHLCQIRIHNKNSTKTADNVRVELIALEDAAGGLADDYFRPKFPIILNPEIAGENTINPGASQKYNLFRVTMNVKTAIIKDGVATGWQQKFLAYFTQETGKNVTQFIWKEFYRLKLAVTAREFVKLQQEFNLTFSDEGTFCRFRLATINSIETKTDKIKTDRGSKN